MNEMPKPQSKSNRKFVELVKAVIDERGLTRQEAADLCGMSRTRLQDILGGNRGDQGMDTIDQIADALQIEIDFSVKEEATP